MQGYVGKIEALTLQNTNCDKFYTLEKWAAGVDVATAGEDIGMEVHEHVDQFFRIESGIGKVVMNGEEAEVTVMLFIVPAEQNTTWLMFLVKSDCNSILFIVHPIIQMARSIRRRLMP